MKKRKLSKGLSLFLTLMLLGSLIAVPQVGAEDAPDESVTASYTYHGDQIAHVIDGIISYDDTPKSRWTAYESPNAQDWIRTTYATARAKDAVGVYLFSDGGGIKIPTGIDVEFWNGTNWEAVSNPIHSPASLSGNERNLIRFDSVTSTDFRIVLTHGEAKSGVSEVRYWDSETEELPTGEVVPLGIVSASYTFRLDQVGHVNDGITSYQTEVKNRWTAYESPNASDWIQTNFGGAVTKDAVGIYLYSDGGGVRAPLSYDVQYQDAGGDWVSVPGQTKIPAAPEGNKVNLVTFDAVSAQKFRVLFIHDSEGKSGVTEITYVDTTRSTLPAELTMGAATASYANNGDSVATVNDGILSFSDFPRNRWTSYGSPNSSDWVETTYPASKSINAAGVYLYDDEGGVQTPASFDVEYWDGDVWTSVPNQVRTPADPAGNALNLVVFDTVVTDRLRVVFDHRADAKSGASEIVYVDAQTAPLPLPAEGLEREPYILVNSPELGSSVSGEVEIGYYAPDMKNIAASIWHQPDEEHPDPNGYAKTLPNVTPDEDGYGTLVFNADEFPRGPLVVVMHGWDSPAGDPNFTKSATTYVQLYNENGVDWQIGLPAAPPQAAGMSVKFADDFDGPLSISKTGVGTTYTSTKPDWPNGSQFGEAIFADPTDAVNPFDILSDDILRIRVTKAPEGYIDPMGWNRKYIGGLLSSVRLDGTGISATNGYFEARMQLPAGKGAWPAFWLMSQNSSGPDHLPSTAELDTIEGYGHNPQGACQAKHWWSGNPETHATNCSSANFAYGDSASTWHIYGTKVTDTEVIYYIDNVEVWRHDTFEQANTPLYFMINLALGGGWPIDLATYHDQIDLYVDYVRVFEPTETVEPEPTPSSGPQETILPTPTPAPSGKPGVIHPSITKDDNDATISSFDEHAWSKALEEAKSNGMDTVVIDVQAEGTILQKLPPAALDGLNGMYVSIRTPGGAVTLPVGWLSGQLSGGDGVVVRLEPTDKGLNLSVWKDGTQVDPAGLLLPAGIALPYKPTVKQLAAPEFLIIKRSGGASSEDGIVSSGRYDAASGGMRFAAKLDGASFTIAYDKKTFSDASANQEMRHATEVLASKGIIHGVSGNQFNPQGMITRADYVTLLMRMFAMQGGTESESAFSDVDIDSYYGAHVAAAHDLGIVHGVGAGLFLPDSPISRDEMVMLTYRTLKAAGLIEEHDSPAEALVQAGFLKGTASGLELDRSASRAEAATILYRIYLKL
ncbi:S-layer homology domain-containing protein [Paenibacillus sp. strain BS8-2]